MLVAGQAHDDVGSHAAVVAADPGDLLVEVAPGQQPRELEHAAQLHLAPGAPHGRGVERPGERLGLSPQRGGRGLHLGDGLLEGRELGRAVALEGADLLLHPPERLAQRAEGRCGLGVVGHRRLEVDDALAQQVALGADGREPHGGALADDDRRDGRSEHQSGEQGEQEVHACDCGRGH